MSFLYNVGPGSASVWLPIGSFAPRHVLMADDGFQPAPPFSLVGNENTQLDGRYSAVDADAAGERRDFDPSKTPLEGAYVAMFQDYVENDLKWTTDLHYPSAQAGRGEVHPRGGHQVAGADRAPHSDPWPQVPGPWRSGARLRRTRYRPARYPGRALTAADRPFTRTVRVCHPSRDTPAGE